MYNQHPIYCPKIRAFLSIGSFVLFRKEMNSNYCKIGRIVSAAAYYPCINNRDEKLTINLFLPVTLLKNCRRPKQASMMLSTDTHEPIKQRFLEVYQFQQLLVISTQQVENPCFVFTRTWIETEALTCEGIRSCFICLCDWKGRPVDKSFFVSFPSEHHDYGRHINACYSIEIWNGIKILQDCFQKLLNK